MRQADNEFPIDGGAIVVQSCDEQTANVGIYLRGRMTYHHVAVPSLDREWRKIYYNDEVQPAEFDEILQANKFQLLKTIGMLCGRASAGASVDHSPTPLVCPSFADLGDLGWLGILK